MEDRRLDHRTEVRKIPDRVTIEDMVRCVFLSGNIDAVQPVAACGVSDDIRHRSHVIGFLQSLIFAGGFCHG